MPNALAEHLKLKLDEDQLTNCMRCGFCLPACPTFRETGVEAESPRGRIALMKAVADGIMEPDQLFQEQMNHCLGCRACEPACPADVHYGSLLEQARNSIEQHGVRHRPWVKLLRAVAFRHIFPKQKRVRMLGSVLAAYKKTGLQKAARRSGLLKLFPKYLRQMEQILPEASSKGVVERLGEKMPAVGAPIAKVGLFRGCIMDILFSDTNVHTAELLAAAGFEVILPAEQNCCGAMHAHNGELEQAKELARWNIRVFRETGVDFIASNAGGCGTLLIEYDHLLKDDPEWEENASWFAGRVKDTSELLLEFGRPLRFKQGSSEVDTDNKIIRVTYQDSCHLRNVMKGGISPRKLLHMVPGAEFIEMKEADRCCGSAGTYNLTQPEMAGQILEHKMEHANAVSPSCIVTSNPGCLLQMKLGVFLHGLSKETQVKHINDFLYERIESPAP
ncbi:(Fe-S)-binding protein [Paenibacillus larvae]|uniref:Glycolate oxidase iron-sulfur subunit n=3 Tax=Paenibacillus larvae TaxID=1464 RepID=A0A6C0QPF0_9BACL|nr:(Fe-S)-binding protein [Paenibacillus larvae]AVF23149.1 putative glycolate oxidase iron-sulfur subunit GlcF [Paenibacillus larvae subsp. larvae]ETK26176.1 putative glycolate oxidase iron-sulfur subunit GlcF [Paenibacillus larvae subsp. larvae DSM 25719]PCK72214.1 glycolate oxidase iron-sulfur subunit-like protein [Paenibacillus larvae subsp. larvae B-3650]QHZ50599.1 putative glycolate oxidase iron-sulfur subunit GlcF [Paenibacillus larvae subsp. larvae]